MPPFRQLRQQRAVVPLAVRKLGQRPQIAQPLHVRTKLLALRAPSALENNKGKNGKTKNCNFSDRRDEPAL